MSASWEWYSKSLVDNWLTEILFLQTYVKSQDKQFAAATIQAIGRCATNITEVTDTCLNGLVCLLSNRDGKPKFSLFYG